MQERFGVCGPTTFDPAPIIIIDAYLDDCSTGEMLIFRSSTQNHHPLETPMTDSFDEYLIDLLSESKPAARQYDKLQEGGMATRFVKGTSGNPSGRPKRRIEKSIRD
jgi:hypothetical protein